MPEEYFYCVLEFLFILISKLPFVKKFLVEMYHIKREYFFLEANIYVFVKILQNMVFIETLNKTLLAKKTFG